MTTTDGMDMNRWLYRAAGTVGVAGGFLLLAAGSAQADEAEDTEALLGDVFSPTSGLPPLDLPAGDIGTPDTSTLTLDPHDGRLGEPELLPGLPALPIGLDSLLNMVPLHTPQLDTLPINDDLVRMDGDPVGLPTRLVDTGYHTLPAALSGAAANGGAGAQATDLAYPAPLTPASHTPAQDATQPEIVGSMPFLTQPIKDRLLPGQPLGQLSMVGGLVGQVPVAGPMVHQNLRALPLVDELVPSAQRQSPALAGDPLTGASSGEQLPAVIADELATERGYSPELLGGGGLPLIGNGLDPLGQMFGVGNLPAQLPVAGPLVGPLLGNLPMVGDAADPAAPSGPTGPGLPLPNPLEDPNGAAGERPIAGEDTEYTESAYAESAYSNGSPEILPGLPALPLDPLSVLQSLPLIGPVTGSLPL